MWLFTNDLKSRQIIYSIEARKKMSWYVPVINGEKVVHNCGSIGFLCSGHLRRFNDSKWAGSSSTGPENAFHVLHVLGGALTPAKRWRKPLKVVASHEAPPVDGGIWASPNLGSEVLGPSDCPSLACVACWATVFGDQPLAVSSTQRGKKNAGKGERRGGKMGWLRVWWEMAHLKSL